MLMQNDTKNVEKILFENDNKILELAELCASNNAIDKELYTKF